MASLLPKNGVLFTAEKEAPAPSKDYCNIIVTRDTVIYRWWKVTLRKDVPLAPGGTQELLRGLSY